MTKEILNKLSLMNVIYISNNYDYKTTLNTIYSKFFNKIDYFYNYKKINVFDLNNYDLIICDIEDNFEINGINFIKYINLNNIEIPIIIISNNNNKNTLLQCIQLNIEYFLIKPIQMENFKEAMFNVVKKIKLYKNIKEKNNIIDQYLKLINESNIVSKTDKRGVITKVNENFCNISGYKKEELLGKKHNIIRHPEMKREIFEKMWKTISKDKKIWSGFVKNKKKNGESYYTDSYIMPLLDLEGNIKEYVSFRNDITFSIQHKNLLKDYINTYKETTVVFIKIINFNYLFDFYGEEITKNIEKYIYKKFSNFPYVFKIFNLENGEFMLVKKYDKINYEKEIEEIKKIQNLINNENYIVNNTEISLFTTISVFFGNNVLFKVKELMKENLLNHINFNNKIFSKNFENEMKLKIEQNILIANIIKNSIKNNNIINVFQKVVNSKNPKEIYFYESLVRIKDNNKLITPFFFIEISKKLGYYFEITKKVLNNSFEALNKIDTKISINLSRKDFENIDIQNEILRLLNKYKEKSNNIIFEILETEETIDIDKIIFFIKEIKKFGILIAIDDFGSGYSNFQKIMKFSPDIIKIDGELIKNCVKDKISYSIIKSLVIFAKENNIKIVGEFVENKEIFEMMKKLKIDYSQGYYFHKPNFINKNEKEN